MVIHKGIDWPTEVTPDLVDRLRERLDTLSLPVAIATEIYELGTEFRSKLLESQWDANSLADFVTKLVDAAEASGYARVGYEILYFDNPQGLYIPVKDFLREHLNNTDDLFDAKLRSLNPWRDITPLLSIKHPTREGYDAIVEPQIAATEADVHIRSRQIVKRKLDLLKGGENDPYELLQDLLKESDEEFKKSDSNGPFEGYEEVWRHLNLLRHATRGIRAGIIRYDQLYRENTI